MEPTSCVPNVEISYQRLKLMGTTNWQTCGGPITLCWGHIWSPFYTGEPSPNVEIFLHMFKFIIFPLVA